MNNWNPGMREKAEMILKVRGGLMSAAEAARKLGISRKTYYKWERRGLEAMMEAELGSAARRAGWRDRADEAPYPGTGT